MSRPVKSKLCKQFKRKPARTRSLLLLMEPLRVLFRQKLDSRTYAQGVQLGKEISKRKKHFSLDFSKHKVRLENEILLDAARFSTCNND